MANEQDDVVKARFADEIYITTDEDGDDDFYYCAWTDMDGIENGDVVGVYKLVRLARMKVGRTLVEA